MTKLKRWKLYLNKLDETSKKPPPNSFIEAYTIIEVEGKTVKRSKNDRMTIAKLAEIVETGFKQDRMTIAKLAEIVEAGFKQDRMTIAKLAEEMREGFKQVNERIDNIEKRLDYNNLKPLPKENR